MMTKSNGVCAGIVLYNPDMSRVESSISAIMSQVDRLLLVDNGSDDDVVIRQLAKKNADIHIIRNDENKGIAYALNQICDYAQSHDCKWAFTLDHDTICPSGIINALLSHSNDEVTGIVCPAVFYEGLNVETKSKTDNDVEDIKACMTSASLTSLKAWKEVGGFNESYFIDYVDNDFCMKLKLKGYSIIRVKSCFINHQLGKSRSIKMLGNYQTGTSHSPLRCYYMMRNNILFLKEYKSHLPLLKEVVKVFYVAYHEFLFSEQRKETFSMLVKGISDGIK